MANFTINICGRNRVHIPEEGCSDCTMLEIEVDKLKEAIEALSNSKMSISDIIAGDNITVTDNGNGTVTVASTVREPGYFTGADNITIKQGEIINLFDDVKAFDSNGNRTEFTVIPSEINECAVGDTLVAYIADGASAVRKITIEAIEAPTISGVSSTLTVVPGEEFDPLEGVTAIDGNGIPIEVEAELVGNALQNEDGDDLTDENGNPIFADEPKNLMPYPYTETTKTVNGITFTDNGDRSLTVNGTSTNSAKFRLQFNGFPLPAGTYTLKGTGRSDISVNLVRYDSAAIPITTAYKDDVTFTLDEQTNVVAELSVNNGATIDNVTVYPAIYEA